MTMTRRPSERMREVMNDERGNTENVCCCISESKFLAKRWTRDNWVLRGRKWDKRVATILKFPELTLCVNASMHEFGIVIYRSTCVKVQIIQYK